ncbi:MAG: HlyD family efflux transporter periplasmic adaptor subunit, partial [Thiotrichaceae bacterium]|nr:HlyD family efflux transporter periplasmic adaptor subunit [Thiotrichaceae bacterium]
ASPPAIVSRGLLYLILIFSLIIIIWSMVNKIDVIISVPALVEPEGKLEFIQPPASGTVQQILIKEGSEVKQGDALIVYRADEINPLIAELKAREKEFLLAKENRDVVAVARVESLDLAVSAEKNKQDLRATIHQTNLSKLSENNNRLQLEIKNTNSIYTLLEHEYDIIRKLSSKGVVPEQKKLELARLKEESAISIDSLKSSLRETRLNKKMAIQQFNLELEQYKTNQQELSRNIELIIQAADDRYQINKIAVDKARDLFRLRLQGVFPDIDKIIQSGAEALNNSVAIKATVDGIVAELFIQNPGQSIERGQTILTLVPAGVTMKMKLRVPDKDIGKMVIAQQIKFKFDAFPFVEHGVLNGRVESIGAVKVSNGATFNDYYQVSSSLNQQYFRIEDHPFFLLPGMSATAEILNEQKRVIELLLAPISGLGGAKSAGK